MISSFQRIIAATTLSLASLVSAQGAYAFSISNLSCVAAKSPGTVVASTYQIQQSVMDRDSNKVTKLSLYCLRGSEFDDLAEGQICAPAAGYGINSGTGQNAISEITFNDISGNPPTAGWVSFFEGDEGYIFEGTSIESWKFSVSRNGSGAISVTIGEDEKVKSRLICK